MLMNNNSGMVIENKMADERADRANNERGFEAARQQPNGSCQEIAKNAVAAGDFSVPEEP